jgi:hypothetical protein
MPAIQTIRHPTNLSENSCYAFQLACTLAKDFQARLILFRVIPAPGGCVLPVPVPNPFQAAEV